MLAHAAQEAPVVRKDWAPMKPTAPKDTPAIFDILPIGQADAYRSAQGTTLIWRPARGVMVNRVEGVLTEEAGTALETAIKRTVADEHIYIGFNDWDEMTDYTMATRLRLTQTVYEHLKITRGIHFILRSKIVAFGVQAANLVLKNLTVHPTRESFERTLRETLRRVQAISRE
jgi:hypothetical protein